jgi:hypothetical protein
MHENKDEFGFKISKIIRGGNGSSTCFAVKIKNE